MRSGDLNEKITLQSPTRTNNGGELIDSYTTVATVAAKILSEHGSEAFQSARNSSNSLFRILIRYRPDVVEDWGVIWMGRFYNVVNIDASLRRKGELWMTVENRGGA